MDLELLLTDCRRFVLTYSPCIHAAPMQLYHLALSIAPTASHVRTIYSHERNHAVIVDHGALTNWAPCLDVFPGHGGYPVEAVTFAEDGSCFVTGGADNKATVWKTATRTPVASFIGHRACVRDVAVSPDGLHIVSGSQDGMVCVWQASSGVCIHILTDHMDDAFSVAYSGDGRRILSATVHAEVKLWNAIDGRCLLTLDQTGNITWQVAISSDGGVIARGDGASVCLYDVSTATSETLEFLDTVRACTFSPDGRYIAAKSDHVIRVWAWPYKFVVRSIDVAEGLCGRLAFSYNSTLIGSGSKDGSMRMWQVASDGPPCILQGHTSWVRDLAYSPGRSQVVSVSLDGMVRVWDATLLSITATDNTAIEPPMPAPGPPRFVLISSAGDALSLLHLPTLGLDAAHFALGTPMSNGAPTAAFFDGVITCEAALQAVEGWFGDDSDRTWATLIGQQHVRLSRRPFAISLDGSLIAYRSSDSTKVVDICDPHTGTMVATLVGHTDNVHSITFSSDHACLVTGSGDKSVKVWDTSTGALICGHTEHRSSIRATAFSPDGRLVASGSGDGTVRIFDVATQLVVRVLDSHQQLVAHMMFASDNIHFMTLNHASWAHVWDVTTGACIREFCLQDHRHLRSPILSSDDTGILIGGDDGALRSVSFWKPGTRVWPAYHITRDGWVYAMSPGKSRRLCWLPVEWRTPISSCGTVLYVGEANSDGSARKVIALNMSELLEYIDSLDASP